MDRRVWAWMIRRRTVFGTTGLAVLALCVVAPSAHAQSASTWNKRGQAAEQREDYDAAFEAYRQARLLKPNDLRYKTHFERLRFQAAAAHVDRGRVMRQNGDVNGALVEFQRAIAIDGGNQAAQQEIEITERQMSARPDPLAAPAVVPTQPSQVSAGPIELQAVSNDSITLHMVEDTKIIYQAIGKMAGLNVIFDPDYTPKRIPVDLNGVSLPDALRIVGVISGTFWKPVTSNTIFVAQNTRTKHTDLDPMAVQTFYLTNAGTEAEENQVLTTIRNVLDPSAKPFLIQSQNAIVIRATPDQLLLAQELLNNLDRARAEVVVDVAVLEVNRDKVRNLGITLPQSFSVTPQASNATTTNNGTNSSGTTTTTTTPLTLNNLAHMNGSNFAVSVGTAAVNALLTDTDTRVLQNPKIRATDGQNAKLSIGSKIPVATGSYSSGAASALVSSLVNTQFTYLDIGVLIDMTPTVHQNHEVTLKIKIEVSSQTGQVTISGVTEPILGQRKSEQVIQLKDGEPSILAGILTKSESDSISGTPGLGELPILKHFFNSHNRERSQTEVIFLLIPHIVRESVLTRMNTRPIDTGTGQAIELRREISANSASTPAPADLGPTPRTTAAAAAAAMIGAQAPNAAEAARAAQLSDMNLSAPAPTAAPVSFTVAPPNGVQASGSTFQMAVMVNNATDIYSVPLQVQFNPQVLQLVNVDAGEMLGRDGQSVAVVHRDEGNGLVTLSASRPPGVKGISGQGSVAVLTFRALAPGDSNVALSKVGAKNSAQANLPAVGSQAVVHVK